MKAAFYSLIVGFTISVISSKIPTDPATFKVVRNTYFYAFPINDPLGGLDSCFFIISINTIIWGILIFILYKMVFIKLRQEYQVDPVPTDEIKTQEQGQEIKGPTTGKVRGALALILKGVLITFFYFFFIKNPFIVSNFLQSTKSKIKCATSADISLEDWITYKDEVYGFEFKYPSDWLLKVDVKSFGHLKLSGERRSVSVETKNLKSRTDPAWGNVSVRKGGIFNLVIVDYTDGPRCDTTGNYSYKEPVTVDGIKGLRWKEESSSYQSSIELKTSLSATSKPVCIYLDMRYDSKRKCEFVEIFDQIISTFKFVPGSAQKVPKDTSDWKTYIDNEGVGFSINIPNNWEVLKTNYGIQIIDPDSNYGFTIDLFDDWNAPKKVIEDRKSDSNYTTVTENTLQVGVYSTLHQIASNGNMQHTQNELWIEYNDTVGHFVFLTDDETRTKTVSTILSSFRFIH